MSKVCRLPMYEIFPKACVMLFACSNHASYRLYHTQYAF